MAFVDKPVQCLWIMGRQRFPNEEGPGRQHVHASSIYTPYVKEQIVQTVELPHLALETAAKQFAGYFQDLTGKALGLALCRQVCTPDSVCILNKSERAVADYFACTKWRGTPLMYSENCANRNISGANRGLCKHKRVR